MVFKSASIYDFKKNKCNTYLIIALELLVENREQSNREMSFNMSNNVLKSMHFA